MFDPSHVARQLTLYLQEHPEWSACGPVEFSGEGLDFLVFRFARRDGSDVAVKVPRSHEFRNDNDGVLSPESVIEKEVSVVAALERVSFPVARVLSRERVMGEPALFQEFIVHDQTKIDDATFGGILARLHGLCPPSSLLRSQALSVSGIIAERLVRRIRVLNERTGAVRSFAPMDLIEQHLKPRDHFRSLLHMDLRPENLLVHAGELRAVIDWGNALIGDPELEMARLEEYGVLTGALRDAYDRARIGGPRGQGPTDGIIKLIYRLDTAVMLALVFISERPSPVLAGPQLRRVSELSRRLEQELALTSFSGPSHA